MDLFIIIEMADVELIGVTCITDETAARELFEQSAAKHSAPIWEAHDVARKIGGTLAVAGDDSYSVQLVKRTATEAATTDNSHDGNLAAATS